MLLIGVILFSSLTGPLFNGVENFETDSTEKNMTNGYICPVCKKDGTCTCHTLNLSNTFTLDSSGNSILEELSSKITTSTIPTQTVSTPGVIEPDLQGKHPIPYFELVDRVRNNEEIEEKQSKHIEDIRKVLANTITSLKKDDVLPSGSHCSCASAPVIDPLSGEVDLTEGCRPPGWLRMMNSRNTRDEECSD